ncbi:735d7434-c02c-47da-b22c-2c4d8c0388ff [Sclerotinia trifoliorum]|uniref:735d7434-c02c-47da-b22c-2c4d8c0388ff n=1 Tax=Sclerotinia trifoliorum TaxID=28548 RepID=A0A8H2W4N1_9HELO|nr:735d7434-c02c-47da-b22c-2c4d8c0388ff [Sclerotinia trifoliorum]
MAPGGPAAGRGRGGKFKKFTRGGGKHFSRDLRPLDANGNEIREKNADDSSSEEEEDSEEESSEEEEEEKLEMTREQRRAAAKAKKEAAIKKKNQKVAQVGDLPTDSEEESEDDDMPVNPNHSKAARNQAKAPPKTVDEVAGDVAKMSVSKKPQELSRKEREAIEAQKKKEAYQRLHLAGKTDEAQADLARLAKVREDRRLAAERKAAEEEERKEQEQAKSEQLAREQRRRDAAMGPAAKGKKGKK